MCKVKKKNSFVQGKANWIQETKFDKDEVFKAYHQRVIWGKIAPYVAKVKIEKENVALEIDTGASVSILNKKTCLSIYLSVNLLPISSKIKE